VKCYFSARKKTRKRTTVSVFINPKEKIPLKDLGEWYLQKLGKKFEKSQSKLKFNFFIFLSLLKLILDNLMRISSIVPLLPLTLTA